jgi:tRNA (guanine37-N1)-methyltransferase
MRFDVVTLFPEMFTAVTASGITRRALDEGLWSFATWNPRDFTSDNYRTVDDRPYGGGPGMVMLADPLDAAVEAARRTRSDAGLADAPVVLMSPQGKPMSHRRVIQMKDDGRGAIVVCGRYEAIDERWISRVVDEEISVGDFVLSGGEIAAMALIDAVVRQLPGALGGAESAAQDSFAIERGGLLDTPHYTRPETWRDDAVPAVLLSGHHANIVAWRRARAIEATWRKRPELIAQARADGSWSKQDEETLRAVKHAAAEEAKRSPTRSGDAFEKE